MNAAPAQLNRSAPDDVISSIAVLTTVVWLGCLLVGALGFVLPYARPRPTTLSAPVLRVELITVELAGNPWPVPDNITAPPSSGPQPPPLFPPAPPPRAPQMIAVAQPSPAIAFARPLEVAARIVEFPPTTFVRSPTQRAPVAPAGTDEPGARPAPAPPLQTLTYGEGDGRQPAPSYPDSARRAGQEGAVVVRFSVAADGRVLAAEPSAPSPWTALNREALRVVREQWRFQPGPARLYEVAIRFELKK